MSLSSSLFKKDLYNLEVSDLEEFFTTEQSETSLLEFKSGDVEIDKIHREVCAFLNTEGGLLIIGAPRENKGNTGTCVGSLTPSTKHKSVDSIIQSLTTGISPSPAGIKGKHLDTGYGVIHILEVPQSQTPPHQVNGEGKYYIRLEKEAKAAPHGIVEALFSKRQKPKLKMGIEISAVFANSTFEQKLSATISNESDVTAEYTSYLIELYGDLKMRRGNRCIIQDTKDGVRIEPPQNSWVPLVKGINIFFDAEINLFSKHVLVNALCWCKDATLTRMLGIYSKPDHGFIHQYHSNKDDNQFTAEAIRNIFEKLER